MTKIKMITPKNYHIYTIHVSKRSFNLQAVSSMRQPCMTYEPKINHGSG